MFDISKLNTTKLSNEGVKVYLDNPITGEKKVASVTIHGFDSDFWNDNIKDDIDEAVKAIASLKNKDFLKVATTSDINKSKLETFFFACSSWDGFFDGEKELEFNKENFLKVGMSSTYFLEIIENALGDRQTFLVKEQDD